MRLTRRVILLIGAVCLFHSSLVPPVGQGGGEVCRYHEFTERAWPFTRLYSVEGGDGVALMTEVAIIVSLVAIGLLVVSMVSEAKTGRDDG